MFDEGDKIRTVRRLHGPLGGLLGPLGSLLGASLSELPCSIEIFFEHYANTSRTYAVPVRSREVPVGGPGSHRAQARSPFQGRNGTAPTGEAVSRKETFLRLYAAYAKVVFLRWE